MRIAGRIVAETLRLLKRKCDIGVTLAELDQAAERYIRSKGAFPTFKGYHGYPASVCLSVNEQVVHGIPSRRKLKSGDILGIDCGATFQGWVADAALTVMVGDVGEPVQRLVERTRGSLIEGIEAVRVGMRVGDIGFAIESFVKPHHYGIVREYCGHGVGQKLHEDPQVPNFGEPGKGPRLQPGMCLAIEPMINLGTDEVELLDDGWTVVTRDRRPSAHFELSVVCTEGDPEVLTLCEDGTPP